MVVIVTGDECLYWTYVGCVGCQGDEVHGPESAPAAGLSSSQGVWRPAAFRYIRRHIAGKTALTVCSLLQPSVSLTLPSVL